MDHASAPDRHWRGRLQEPREIDELLAGPIDQALGPFWKTAVRKYTKCNLKYGKDKLVALWGIAKLLRDMLQTEYGEGLWEENLQDQLAWRVEECRPGERPNESTSEFLERDIPSWSWASVDGIVVVADRLSDQSHYKVTDHDGKPLSFDLKGAKRLVWATSKRVAADAPSMPPRGISDSGPELQRRSKELAKEGHSASDEKSFHQINGPVPVDRNDQPEFYSKSIRIQGHVGHGQLQRDSTRKRWLLQVAGVTDVDVVAFPDIVPALEDSSAKSTYFVVLAAKQVIKPPELNIVGTSSPETQTGGRTLAKIDESTVTGGGEDHVDYAGHGILMKYTSSHHFCRTGAFKFRNASDESFKRLQKTANWDKLSPEQYHPGRGRKFWLD
ncbi:hypothetical protein N0V83_004264 [Neocucurbitaria cava]|uniref:Uncharacterized protein n=1 Tax=Neocucurbitaria cava TaxID=798079 RepID=A0A9W9CP34_9PLEO|nr:hypothetical protein N0V83_004264 [Neocucurbitaria cava]